MGTRGNRGTGDDDSPQAVLAALRDIQRRREALNDDEVALVARARTLNVTWDDIGEATGLAGPNAHRKFSRRLKVVVEPQP